MSIKSSEYGKLFLITLIISLLPMITSAQNHSVTGRVFDQNDHPLQGVSVNVKNTNHGTLSAEDGSFSLTATGEKNFTLLFSYVGFTKKEIVLPNADTSLLIHLELSQNASMDSVVVVGYGTQKQTDVTGSIVSLDTKRLENMPNNNLLQAVEGSVPGVFISQSSADAEGNNLSMDIRGPNSINASNAPLIILDGIVYSGGISDINPNDIASVNFLKDASAAAIYGSRGSNGVMLITTKQGASGKPVISYNGTYGIQKIANLPDVLSPEQFYQYKETREPGSITPSEQAVYDAKAFPDWLDLATREGSRQEHNLSVRGGTAATKYFVSGDYLDSKGVAVNDEFKRISLRTNLTINIASWLTFGTSTQLSYLDRSGLPANFSGDNGAWLFNPLTTAYDASGALTLQPWPDDIYFHNPLEPTQADNTDHAYQIISNNYLKVDFPFVEGLSYKINTGANYRSHSIDTYYGRNTQKGLSVLGSMDQSTNFVNNYVIENILSYNRDFGKHHVDFTGLYSYEYYNSKTNSLHAEGFPNDVLTYYQPDLAQLIQPAASYTQHQLISQMARINYSFAGKYLLTLTGRRDGFSAFGADNKYSFFPSAAAGWNISNESFMEGTKNVLSNLKLRLSYGSNGNQAIDDYSTLAKLSIRNYVDSIATAPGYIPISLANPNLGWETTYTFDAGLDFGFLNNRVTGSIDYYSARTKDLLLTRRIPGMNGIRTILQNIGENSNKGFELGINSTNIVNKDFNWQTNATLSFNRNKLVSLYYAGSGSDTANGLFIGYPQSVNYGYVYDGVFQTGDDIAGSPQPDAQPGYAKVKDLNGDGQITPEGDRTILGSLQPSFIWGMGNTFTYKNFSLYVFVHGVQGTSQSNSLLSDNGVQSGVRHNTVVKNWWTPDNPTNEYYGNIVGSNVYGVDIYQSSAFIRVEDISLSYKFPSKVLKKMNLSSLRLYFDARNMFTITKWTGLDPELDSQTGMPLQKQYTVGLNIGL